MRSRRARLLLLDVDYLLQQGLHLSLQVVKLAGAYRRRETCEHGSDPDARCPQARTPIAHLRAKSA
jgi:hypothetical protein